MAGAQAAWRVSLLAINHSCEPTLCSVQLRNWQLTAAFWASFALTSVMCCRKGVLKTAESCPSAHRLLGLSDAKAFDDLLAQHGGPKKGAMKTTAVASRAGAIKQITATHLGDGQPLTLNMQVGLPAVATSTSTASQSPILQDRVGQNL
jgi:hypothetical protein